MKKKVGIIGATGYAGAELVRLVSLHSEVELAAISSVSFEEKKLSDIYPSFRYICDMVCVSQDEAVKCSDIIFAGLPHGLSQALAKQCRDENKIFIDLGADFRLHSEEDYAQWYDGKFDDKQLHENSVYALPELFRDEISADKVIANPGCYPTSIALGLAPALKNGIVSTQGIVIDSKSGVTGAGRGLSDTTHYPVCNEAFSPYKVACHRHTPEIEQTLSEVSGETVRVTFVPHLLPVNRGIVSTIYARLNAEISLAEIHSAYKKFYEGEQFVRVLDIGKTANLRDVKFSNYCDISLHLDERTGTLVIVSTIDNMVKGAAGQAVQNMNIALGIDEKTGLDFIPPAF